MTLKNILALGRKLPGTARALAIPALALAAPLLFGCQTGPDAARPAAKSAATARMLPSVIPQPASFTLARGHFTVADGTPILCAADNADCAWVARYYTDLLLRTRGLQLAPGAAGANAAPRNTIVLRLAPDAQQGNEGYTLDVTPDGVVISAPTRAGLFYGGATLWQLLTATQGQGRTDVAAIHIQDHPRFGMRGMMVDSTRHFQSPAFIKSFIDTMALHKLNTLHWHLTDDQGWRIEIKKYPRLTSVGAWRTPDEAGLKDIDPATGKPRPYGGFYTQDLVREIVAYARDRNITIIPEIEMPGHATAAIAAYPQLGSADTPPAGPETAWGVFPYLYNVDDATFGFIEDVLTEVMALFPGTYIHIGGDEAVKTQWKASPRIQAQMKALKVADENALQGYFTARVEKFLSSHGRRLIGWDEILEGGIPAEASITSWRGIEGGVTAARTGHDAVLSPERYMYFDWRQATGPGEQPGRSGVTTLRQVYDFNPAPDGLTPEQQKHIVGLQANIWTEYMVQEDVVAYNAFPRASALAELAWTPAATPKDWDAFIARIPAQLARYQALGIRHSNSAIKVVAAREYNAATHKVTVTLSNQAALGDIRYTLDGSAPTARSRRYTAPLTLNVPARLIAGTFADGRLATAASDFDLSQPALLRRESHELRICQGNGSVVQDDAPRNGPRATFLISTGRPCWMYDKLDLTNITAIAASVGQVSSNSHRVPDLLPPSTPDGELEAHLDTCEGERIAVLPLGPARGNDGVTTLNAPVTPRTGVHDVCFVFTRRTAEPVWAINWVQWQPADAVSARRD